MELFSLASSADLNLLLEYKMRYFQYFEAADNLICGGDEMKDDRRAQLSRFADNLDREKRLSIRKPKG